MVVCRSTDSSNINISTSLVRVVKADLAILPHAEHHAILAELDAIEGIDVNVFAFQWNLCLYQRVNIVDIHYSLRADGITTDILLNKAGNWGLRVYLRMRNSHQSFVIKLSND